MKQVKAVILDWAGTAVDYGCMAPVKAFIGGFATIGVPITTEMARGPMGMAKIDHVRAIAAMLEKPLSEEEISKAYAAFEALLFKGIENHCDIKPHVLKTVSALRERKIRIGSTTGYTAAMMEKVVPAAASQGYSPDFCVTPEAALRGRPYPYMIWENMKHFGLVDPREVIKAGDTVADMEEGKNANCWTVGVILGSSEMGLGAGEETGMGEEELKERKRKVRATFYQAGADYIIDDLSELPGVVDEVNRILAQNEPRKLLTPGPLTTRVSVKNAMLTDHCTWDDEYKAITLSVAQDITAIAANAGYGTVLLQGSGSYAVEAMINCLTKKDEKLLFLVNGEYGKRMLRIAEAAGKTFDALTFDETQPVNAAVLEEKLRKDDSATTVVTVHCETTTGVLSPLADIVKTAKKHGKKIFVDAMSSFGAYDIDMSALDIDALASSANKCLEGLPGLAFVIAKKSLLLKSGGNSPSHSLDLYDQYKGIYEGGGKFRFTSPTNILLALRRALDEYQKEGGQKARRERYEENHALLTEGFSRLGIPAVVAPQHQSCIITTFDLGEIDFGALYHTLKEKGFIIYPGKLTARPTFRIGSIGDIYPDDMKRLVLAVKEFLQK